MLNRPTRTPARTAIVCAQFSERWKEARCKAQLVLPTVADRALAGALWLDVTRLLPARYTYDSDEPSGENSQIYAALNNALRSKDRIASWLPWVAHLHRSIAQLPQVRLGTAYRGLVFTEARLGTGSIGGFDLGIGLRRKVLYQTRGNPEQSPKGRGSRRRWFVAHLPATGTFY